MRHGFLLPLIILLIASAMIYYIAVRFTRTPNIQTQETAKAIYKYPNAQKWQLEDRKNVCLLPNSQCSQPTIVTFETADEWSTIYFWYKSAMIQYGWSTNSQIYTSVPSGIVFNNNNNCQADLNPDSGGPLNFIKKKSDLNAFKFTVTCQETTSTF